ncbi:MAG: hypothetical protein H8E36_05185 [Rhodospirillaceae bacterium]|nr:hypothetical protein [Rhodospirillaceae bacterium]
MSIGQEVSVSIDGLTREHLNKYHRLDRKSDYFFQPFRSGSKSHRWVSPKYASSGLQKANTQTFKSVFLHESRSHEWGFASDYINQIKEVLCGDALPEKAPSWPLAVWLYKNVELSSTPEPRLLVEAFYEKFRISDDEREHLFEDDFSNLPP